MAPESVRVTVAAEAKPDEAFRLFTEGLGRWWPREYTWSQGTLERIGIVSRVGGMCYEIGPHGFRCDWGRVLAWEPGRRLALAWQISPQRVPEPNPERASEVEVHFEADGAGTAVTLEHRGFERHGEGARGYAEGMGSPQGWPYILERFAEAARER